MVFNERRFFRLGNEKNADCNFCNSTDSNFKLGHLLVLLLVKNLNIPQYSDFDPIAENVQDPT